MKTAIIVGSSPIYNERTLFHNLIYEVGKPYLVAADGGIDFFIEEDIAAVVGVQVDSVAVGDAPAELAVEVVKIVVAVEVVGSQDRGEKEGVHPAPADAEG